MAAPVTKGQEVELQIDSLAFGGNGVARLDGFVVFVRSGLPGDRVRARVTKVKQGHAEAFRTELLAPGPDRVEARLRPFPGLRRLPLPGSRLRRAARDEGGAGARRARPARRHRRAAARADRPGRVAVSATATSSSTRSRPRPTGRRSASTAPAAGTRCSRSSAASSRPTSATRSATPCGTGRARRGSSPYGQATADGLSPAPRRAGGPEHGPGARPARHRARARSSRPATSSRCCAASRRCARSTGRSTTSPAEVTNLPTRCSGARMRSRRSSSASASACGRTRSCRRTRRWRSGCTSWRSSSRPSPAPRRSTTSTAASGRSVWRWRATR